MARKCSLKACRTELPSKVDSDAWQANGFCDIDCMAKHGLVKAREQMERKRKADDLGIKKRNQSFKKKVADSDRSAWAKKAQAAFNSFIRMRDDLLPCISCGRYHSGQYHAGHYRSVGAAKQLRFNEINCHKQCAPCNNHKSGNITEYRINLIKKIGVESVELLENSNDVKRYSIDEYRDIEATYKAKLKGLAGS